MQQGIDISTLVIRSSHLLSQQQIEFVLPRDMYFPTLFFLRRFSPLQANNPPNTKLYNFKQSYRTRIRNLEYYSRRLSVVVKYLPYMS